MEVFITSTQRKVAIGINTCSNSLNIDFKTIGKLKGACGSIKQMALSDSSPYLASVSLDRYLRYIIIHMILFNQFFALYKVASFVHSTNMLDLAY